MERRRRGVACHPGHMYTGCGAEIYGPGRYRRRYKYTSVAERDAGRLDGGGTHHCRLAHHCRQGKERGVPVGTATTAAGSVAFSPDTLVKRRP